MNVVSLREESRDQGHFYVPQFEIRVEGVGLPRDVLRDVSQVTYKDDVTALDSFEVTVNNWDATTRGFKYVGSETESDLKGGGADAQRFRIFEPCYKEVEVRMGYLGGGLRTMLRGTFTTMEPSFPSGGAPTLTVRGLNVLHQLRRKQYDGQYPDMTDSEIAKHIATLTDKIGGKQQKRFKYPIVVDDNAAAKEPRIPFVAQKNQYDIDFLWSRARQRGYVVFVLEGDPAAQGVAREKRVYFGPSTGEVTGLRDVTFELAWGASLIDFRPTLTTANQIKSVTVNGWNRRTRKPIKETITLDDKALNLNQDLREILNTCDPREEVTVDEPVFTTAQARDRAKAILFDRFKDMVKCSATCVGLPDLRAGQRVRITGLGARFSGTYFVTATTHTINDSGYLTKFDARREESGKGSA